MAKFEAGYFGARFSLYPMTDRYVPVILGAIDKLAASDLEVETDDVSTFIKGDRNAVWATLAIWVRGGPIVPPSEPI